MPGAAAGERAPQQLAGHGEPVALVLAEAEHGAERRHHRPARVVGRVSLVVDDAARRHFLALVVSDAKLALRDRARRHVEHERRLVPERYADADRVGAEAPVGSAVRRHAREGAHVHEVDRHQAFGERHLGEVADAPEMMRVGERHDAGAQALGALVRQLHGFDTDHLAVAAVPVERKKRAGVEPHFRALVGAQSALEQRTDIARDHADAVRVVPGEVGGDEVRGHEARLARLAPARGDDRLDRARERPGGKDMGVGHRCRASLPLTAPKTGH